MSILKKGRRNSEEDTELNMITSMMDMFTIILIFLLFQFSVRCAPGIACKLGGTG